MQGGPQFCRENICSLKALDPRAHLTCVFSKCFTFILLPMFAWYFSTDYLVRISGVTGDDRGVMGPVHERLAPKVDSTHKCPPAVWVDGGSINRSAPWLRCRYIIRERLHSHTCPVNLSVGRMRNTVTLGFTEGGWVLHLMHGANKKAGIRHSSANVSRTTWATVKGLTWKVAIRLKIRPSYSTSIPWYIWSYHTALWFLCLLT